MIVNFEEIEAKDKNKKVLDFLLKKIDMYAEKSNGKDVNLIIDNYQYDCFRMEDEELLPFVLLEGKIEWNVPIKDIRIREIINTFSEDNTQGIEFHFQSRYGIGDRDYDLKKIRRQSLIYWKKYAKEWGMPRKKIQKIARETRKFLYQFPVSPQVLIKSVFCVFSTTIEVRTFQDVYNIRVKDKNKIRSFLKFLGYQQKEKDIYLRVDERIENIKQLCSLCEEYMRIANNKNFYLSSRVKLTVANVFRNISNKFQNIAEKIDLRWSANAYPIEPANGERESKITTFIMFFSIIVMLVISVGGIIFVIKELRNIVTLDQLSLWGSSSGFLGDIVGSIIAGITTIATTYFIVHKNDKIDFHQERMKILPVFQLVYKRNNKKIRKEIKKLEKNMNLCDIFNEVDTCKKQKYIFCLENIGYGIAFNVQRPDRDGSTVDSELGDFEVGRKKYLIYSYMGSGQVTISFSDLYGNRYTQIFILQQYEEKEIKIITLPPEMVWRTHRARYQQ